MPDQGKLAAYAGLIRSWAGRVDLVSPVDLDRLEERHIADSLRLAPLVAGLSAPCVDVGSGAGFPGVPIAIVTGTTWRLLEPRGRRAAFLDEVVRALDLSCEVLRTTAEEAARDPRLARAHGFATARAVAAPPASFSLLLPLLRPGGTAAVFHGPGAELPPDAVAWDEGIATMTAPGPSMRE